MNGRLDRRAFLRVAAAGAGVIALPELVGACGSTHNSSGRSSLGRFVFQVYWVRTPGWAPEFLAADQGLFERAGFSGVDLRFGGPNAAAEPALLSGKAHMGLTLTASFAAAVQQGAPLVCVAADFQHNPLCIVSRPDKPIRTPQDLVGKRVGVQVTSESLWKAFLELANVDPRSFTKVPAQSDPSPLLSGQIDGQLAFAQGAPLSLRLKGNKPVVMMLSDFGLKLYEDIFVVTRNELENHRPRVLAGLKAEMAARNRIARNPQLGVDAVAKHLPDADPRFTRAYLTESLTFQRSAATDAKGLGYLAPADVAANRRTLATAGLTIGQDAFDASLLDQVYANGKEIAL